MAAAGCWAACSAQEGVERAAAVTAGGKVAEGLAAGKVAGKVAEGLAAVWAPGGVGLGGRSERDCHPRQRDIFAPRAAAAPPASASKCPAVAPPRKTTFFCSTGIEENNNKTKPELRWLSCVSARGDK